MRSKGAMKPGVLLRNNPPLGMFLEAPDTDP